VAAVGTPGAQNMGENIGKGLQDYNWVTGKAKNDLFTVQVRKTRSLNTKKVGMTEGDHNGGEQAIGLISLRFVNVVVAATTTTTAAVAATTSGNIHTTTTTIIATCY
jgi:hypothetical protein